MVLDIARHGGDEGGVKRSGDGGRSKQSGEPDQKLGELGGERMLEILDLRAAS